MSDDFVDGCDLMQLCLGGSGSDYAKPSIDKP
jgi:hypothetical protein